MEQLRTKNNQDNLKESSWKLTPMDIKTYTKQDFPGGAVVKNPPANAGDVGLIPGPGRSHMLQSN